MKISVAVAAAIAIVAGCGRSQQETAAAMRHNLSEMRKAIRDFRVDKGRPPKTLDELVLTHYLRSIPKDPVTARGDWRMVTEESVRVDDFTRPTSAKPASGIVDVHSAAPGTDANGKHWSEY